MFQYYYLFASIFFTTLPNEEIVEDCQFCSPEFIPPPEVYFKTCTDQPFRYNHIWTGFDILLWRVNEEGVSCEFSEVAIVNSSTPTLTTTRISQTGKDIHFDWDLGFRASIGYEFAPTDSGIGLYWTRFHQKTRTKEGPNKARWNLEFDTIDGSIAHRVWIDQCFALKPEFSLRYAHIEQHLNTQLLRIYTSSETTTFITSTNQDRQNFWGLGPIFALHSDWYFWCGWSLIGAFDGGIVYGHFNTKHQSADSNSTGVSYCSSNGNSCATLFVFDLNFGIRWENENITLKTVLEHHRYANFNKIGCGGDLNLFGANFGLEIHY